MKTISSRGTKTISRYFLLFFVELSLLVFMNCSLFDTNRQRSLPADSNTLLFEKKYNWTGKDNKFQFGCFIFI